MSSTETSALQRGINFASDARKIPTAEMVASVEGGIHAFPEEDKIVLRSQISQVLQRATFPPLNLPQDELRALHDLRKDKDRSLSWTVRTTRKSGANAS